MPPPALTPAQEASWSALRDSIVAAAALAAGKVLVALLRRALHDPPLEAQPGPEPDAEAVAHRAGAE